MLTRQGARASDVASVNRVQSLDPAEGCVDALPEFADRAVGEVSPQGSGAEAASALPEGQWSAGPISLWIVHAS